MIRKKMLVASASKMALAPASQRRSATDCANADRSTYATSPRSAVHEYDMIVLGSAIYAPPLAQGRSAVTAAPRGRAVRPAGLAVPQRGLSDRTRTRPK
jgi:hypothetical protein